MRDSWLTDSRRVRVRKLGRKAQDVQSGGYRWLSEVGGVVGEVMGEAMEGEERQGKDDTKQRGGTLPSPALLAALGQTCHITAAGCSCATNRWVPVQPPAPAWLRLAIAQARVTTIAPSTSSTTTAAQWTGSRMAVTPVREDTHCTALRARCGDADPVKVAVQVLRRLAGEARRRRERLPRRGMPPEPTANRALLTHRSPGTLPASSPAPRASSSGALMASSASCRRPSRSCAPSTPTTLAPSRT